MKKFTMFAALVCTSAAFANYSQQGYYDNQPNYQGQGYYQNQPYYQSQGGTYYQTQPYNQSQGSAGTTYYQMQPSYPSQESTGTMYQSQPYSQSQSDRMGQPYYQTQPQTQFYSQGSQGGYISQSDSTPSMTSTQEMQPTQSMSMSMPKEDSASTEQDRQINARIRDKLKNMNIKGYETIILRTQNGIVMISGSIDKMEDLMRIRDQVKGVEGVKSVNNQLTSKNR